MDLKSEFKKYIEELGLSSAFVKKYSEQVSLYIESLLDKDIYNCDDVNKLSYIMTNLQSNTSFNKTNTTGNQMYSAGLNHYYRFLSNIDTKNFDDAVLYSLKDNHNARLNRIKKNSFKTCRRQVAMNVFIRNPDIVAERLYLANFHKINNLLKYFLGCKSKSISTSY